MSRRFDLTQCGGRWKVPFMHPKDTDGICPLVDGAARLEPGDAIVGTELARDLGLRVGDRFSVNTGRVTDSMRVSALVDLGIKDLNRRTVIVPLLVLMTLKPKARNPKNVRIDELFVEPPATLKPAPKAPQQKATWFWFFHIVDNVLRATEPFFPKGPRKRAIDQAVAWVTERLNGEDGLGAIYPAMANSVMMFDALGFPEDYPLRATARRSVEKLLVVHDHEAYCQPCVSPIWDTGLAAHALLETGDAEAQKRVTQALKWLEPM